MSRSFMGVDLHKRSCVFTEINSEGKVLRRGKFGNNIEEVPGFARTLTGEVALVVEPTLNYLWFLDQVAPYVGSVHPANPAKVRVIAEAKTKCDRYDSHILAELLRTNFLPESYYVPKEIREIKNLIRQRGHLVGLRASLKNRIRHLMFQNGSRIKAANVSSDKGRREISCLSLSSSIIELIRQCLATIDYLGQEIAALEDKISSSSVGDVERAILKTIPGVGPLYAVMIFAETGDIRRFKSSRAYASYCGLVPSVRASGDKAYRGPITKTGSRALRSVFVEAAIKGYRKSPALKNLFGRVLYKSNVQKARVAIAHKLATITYAMLTKGEEFRVL